MGFNSGFKGLSSSNVVLNAEVHVIFVFVFFVIEILTRTSVSCRVGV